MQIRTPRCRGTTWRTGFTSDPPTPRTEPPLRVTQVEPSRGGARIASRWCMASHPRQHHSPRQRTRRLTHAPPPQHIAPGLQSAEPHTSHTTLSSGRGFDSVHPHRRTSPHVSHCPPLEAQVRSGRTYQRDDKHGLLHHVVALHKRHKPRAQHVLVLFPPATITHNANPRVR